MKCKLDIHAGYKNGRSYIRDVYAGKPFRLVSVGQRKTDNKLYEMIMTSSPGILDGDSYDVTVHLDAYAELQLQVQSYQRLYVMDKGAEQFWNIIMEDHSFFAFVPFPTVPYANSVFNSQFRVEMKDNCQLMVGEIITCGRKFHGEVFQMKSYHSLTEIFHHNRLVIKDNVWLIPKRIPLQQTGILEQFTHQGTLIYYTTRSIGSNEGMIQELLAKANNRSDIEVGISALDNGGFMVRALGFGGEAIHGFFLEIQDFVWDEQYIKKEIINS